MSVQILVAEASLYDHTLDLRLSERIAWGQDREGRHVSFGGRGQGIEFI